MAFKLADALIYIGANTDGLKEKLNAGQTQVTGWAGNLGSVVSGVVGGAVLAGVDAAVDGVVYLGVEATKVSLDTKNAVGTIKSEIGATEEEAQALANMAKDVWANNFTGSVEEAADAVIAVKQNMKEMADASTEDLQRVTEQAISFADAFDGDVGETTNAVNTLMEQFGLTSDEAFDFITTGMQKGMNTSGDFLDSIGEYSNQFRDAGFSADEFFSLMESGQMGGVLGTDKAGDAIKEFRIRFMEMSDDMLDSLDIIGVDAGALWQGMQDGTMTTAEAFNEIMPAVMAMESPLERNAMLTQLFGTQAEDLGPAFFESFSTATTSMADMAGASEGLNEQYNTMGDVVEGYKRRAISALTPITDQLVELGESALPLVEKGFAWFETNMVPVLEAAGEKIGYFLEVFNTGLEDGLTPLEAFKEAIETVFGAEAAEKFQNIHDAWVQFRDVFNQGLENAKILWDAFWPVFLQGLENAQIIWEGFKAILDDFYNNTWLPLTDAISSFASWLSTEVFSFDFQWPELPEFLQFGSPLKLHHKLMDFKQWSDNNPIQPQIGAEGQAEALAAVADGAGGQGQGGAAAAGGGLRIVFEAGALVVNANDAAGGAAAGAAAAEGFHAKLRERGLVT